MKTFFLLHTSVADSGLDPSGIYGMLLHYAMTIVLVGGAMIIFVQLWRKGRLDMDEGPKFQMMQMEEHPEDEEKKDGGK